ncbi:hypothetical protein JD844_005133 [Phrynosoma platyrhinos]|uniref:Matrin-type domain-containing protein n=1 Tax=Phrynosoma platyrhinos TaxID=52577 RepID=A0ABQ7TNM1_PHRPL|nr:hypothetical protein JD844_005133 [Phrynosoma platyrhinos]
METILEQQRRYHEERERLMDVMVKEMLTRKPTICVPMSVEFEELLKARENPSEEAQSKFKSRKHLASPLGLPVYPDAHLLSQEKREQIGTDLVEFTDEEGYGRYLDLHDCYLKYINLKSSEKLDYITYLSTFDQLFDIPKERKNAEYRRYLEMLLEYLQDYTDRVKPLLDQNELFGKIQAEFEKKWDNGTFPGWPKETSSALTHAGAHLDLSAFSSWEELASLGLDRLKSALLALGLKCGGTLEERAQRLFSTKGKSLEALDPSLFAKNPKTKGSKRSVVLASRLGSVIPLQLCCLCRDTERNKDLAFLEAQIYEYVEILGVSVTSLSLALNPCGSSQQEYLAVTYGHRLFLQEQRQLTHENVQRKQARTGEEREEEEEEQISESESEDEENEIIYNPKNLPLGWDGKPIPYWLYKLHGLNISYNCEICGNYTYRGPKAFQRHFAEWRHAHGMRCLGIPNTAHFANVTQIEDAVSLWAKLKQQKASERWQPDTEEEYEDSSGNVVTKKTYEDLKRQGLL